MASAANTPWLDPAVSAYLTAHTTPPDDIQRALIAETRERTGSRSVMQISPDQGVLLSLLSLIHI